MRNTKPRQVSSFARTLEENDDSTEKAERRVMGPPDENSAKRRRKTIAPLITPSQQQNPSSQAKQLYQPSELKALYTDWMELCSKGKITTKNTWTMGLIDYLDEVQDVMDAPETEQSVAQTNFQKASATLDASVKIYSTRVDSVHTDTYKMWGGLSRTKTDKEKVEENEEQAEDGNENAENVDAPKKKTVQKPSAPVVTLETNVAAINMKKLDMEFFIDPLFRKTSASFDQGGARSFLLAQLNVCNGCEIVFDSGDARTIEPNKFVDSPIDLAGLRAQAASLCKDISVLDIDPTYKHFKFSDTVQQLGKVEIESEEEDQSIDDIVPQDWDHAVEERKLAEGLGAAVLPTVGILDVPLDMPGDYYGDMGDDMSQPFVVNLPDEMIENNSQEQKKIEAALKMMDRNSENDYNYFNRTLLENWAGPAHWRFQKTAQETGKEPKEGAEGDDDNPDKPKEKPKRTTTKRKAGQYILDFQSPSKKRKSEISKLLTVAPKSTTLISTAKLAEQVKSAGHLLLPVDVKFDPTSLNLLFNQPQWNIPSLLNKQTEELHEDSPPREQNEWMIPYDEDGGNDHHDDDAGLMDMEEGGDVPINYQPVPAANGIDGPLTLLPMPEKQEKINVNYVSNATFVDVKALKNKLWKQISVEDPKQPPTKKKQKQEKSFREMVVQTNNSIPQQVRESVSVPYYFICLLHLANEHNLEIKQDVNADLKIIF